MNYSWRAERRAQVASVLEQYLGSHKSLAVWGDPELIESLQDSHWNVVGGESQETIATNTPCLVESLEPPEIFDGLVMTEILAYVENPGKLMLKAIKKIKPGGIVVVSVPNILNPGDTWGLERAWDKVQEWWSGSSLKSVRHAFTIERVQRLLGMVGLILLEYNYIGDDSYPEYGRFPNPGLELSDIPLVQSKNSTEILLCLRSPRSNDL